MKKVAILTSLLVVLGLIFWGCGNPTDLIGEKTPNQVDSVAKTISDGAHGGNEHFFFLPPLVDRKDGSVFNGVFDPTVSPMVQIIYHDPEDPEDPLVLTTFTRPENAGKWSRRGKSEIIRVHKDHYEVKWDTTRFEIKETTYRIRVRSWMIWGYKSGTKGQGLWQGKVDFFSW